VLREIEIVLSGPICNCKSQDLGWGFAGDSLRVFCKRCNTNLYVEKSKIQGCVVCDSEYPDGLAEYTEIIDKSEPANVSVLYSTGEDGKPVRHIK